MLHAHRSSPDAFPFYNVLGAVRTILFDTKNQRRCALLCDVARVHHFLSRTPIWRSHRMDGRLALQASTFPMDLLTRQVRQRKAVYWNINPGINL